jgi:hypothetical protein
MTLHWSPTVVSMIDKDLVLLYGDVLNVFLDTICLTTQQLLVMLVKLVKP